MGNDTLKEIISQKDIELLQIARHASLAEITTGIAHELAQPLTGIKCIAQNMIDDINLNEFDALQSVADLTKMSSLVDRSSSIINHIRTFTRKRNFSFQQVDLNASILNAIELINNQMKNNGIDIIFALDDSVPKIYGDNLSLEQLFINLILNSKDAILAKKDMHDNFTGIIKITTIFYNKVKLVIEDNGYGIPKDIIPKIWTPFFTTKMKGNGTGIGLSLSHRIIEEHNADVAIDSSDEGTAFTILFPVP
jgi:signal transduction histidine kinase